MHFPSSEPQDRLTEFLVNRSVAYACVGMGIGKSAAVLAALDQLFCNLECTGALIIAPLRVTNLTWTMEPEDWDQFNYMRVANLRTEEGRQMFMDGTAHLYLINYESLPTLIKLIKQRGDTVPFDTVVYDEITKCKNPSAKRIQAWRRCVAQPQLRRRWGLTGTPVPNSLLDLFAQVRLLDKGERFGTAFDTFKRTYFVPLDYMQYNWGPMPDTEERIQKKISDITITLRSKDWVDVAEPIIEDVEIAMPPALLKEYRDFEKELVMQLKDAEITAVNAAALVSKLLQFTSGTIYDAESNQHGLHDLKIKALQNIVKQTKSPVLVAYAFKSEALRLREAFPQGEFFADAKNDVQQKDMLNRWNAGQIPILFSHPRSASHGLNMQKGGHTIVWTTMTYSREEYEQLIGRLARRGQQNQVTVHRLLCSGTVDDAVATALEAKQGTENRLLSALQKLETYRYEKTTEMD